MPRRGSRSLAIATSRSATVSKESADSERYSHLGSIGCGESDGNCPVNDAWCSRSVQTSTPRHGSCLDEKHSTSLPSRYAALDPNMAPRTNVASASSGSQSHAWGWTRLKRPMSFSRTGVAVFCRSPNPSGPGLVDPRMSAEALHFDVKAARRYEIKGPTAVHLARRL
jgi:hypothetical protein